MRVFYIVCWLVSIVVLASLVFSSATPAEPIARFLKGYAGLRDGLPLPFPAALTDALLFYLLFGIVEKAFSEAGYVYAGLVAKYQSRKLFAKAGRIAAAALGVLLWPVSIALDIIAMLTWNHDTGAPARDASMQTLRRLRLGLSWEEIEDVVDRFGRLTYMARPLFAALLILSYVLIMLGVASIGG